MIPVLTLSLPIPDARLSPNGRTHFQGKAKLTKKAREHAYLATLTALQGAPPPPVATYALRFYYKIQRRRDDDNAIAITKAYRDGIAQALRIDDAELRIHAAPELLIDRASPRLEILFYPPASR